MQRLKVFLFFIFLLLIISCGVEKNNCEYLGKKYYPFDNSTPWMEIKEMQECEDNKEKIFFNIKHESCLNLDEHKVSIIAGKRTFYFGDFSARVSGEICCKNKKRLSSIDIRIIDVNQGLVYQWSKKESYTLCGSSEVYITLPYDNQNLDYSINF